MSAGTLQSEVSQRFGPILFWALTENVKKAAKYWTVGYESGFGDTPLGPHPMTELGQ
jgi:hypothetical protein